VVALPALYDNNSIDGEQYQDQPKSEKSADHPASIDPGLAKTHS
jgi:hypothetical protein